MSSTLILQAIGTCDETPISVVSNTMFAAYNGYDLITRHHKVGDYASAWDKVIFLMEELVRKCYEYIYVLGNNSCVADIRTNLSRLLESSNKSVIMYKGLTPEISTDGFLVRNTIESQMFFQDVLDYVEYEAPNLKNIPLWDTEVVSRLYPKWDNVIGLSDRELFNLK